MRSALLAMLVLAGTSHAAGDAKHPGPALVSSIDFRKGNPQDIVAGLTFGMVTSHDGGATWHWMCERALHYGGFWLPDYAYAASGDMFAATNDGPYVNRTGCGFDPTPLSATFMSTITHGPDGALYMAASKAMTPTSAGESRIFKSTDGGQTFPVTAMPGQVGDWWESIEVAPSNAQRVYLTGYRSAAMMARSFLLFRSDDGGASFQPMSSVGFMTSRDSEISIAGISATNPDVVFVRVSYQRLGVIGDGIYRSIDGGQTWTQVFAHESELAFVVRANGDLVVGSRYAGLHVSTSPSNGDAWTKLTGAPEVNCLVEAPGGQVWACTQNYGTEDAAIMKSTDLTSWTKVLRFQDINGPIACAPGTPQRDICTDDVGEWCLVRSMFGIAADPSSCPVEQGIDNTDPEVPCDGCCCQANSSGPGVAGFALAGAVGVVVRRRRRRPARSVVSSARA